MTSQDVAGFQGFTGVLSVNVHASCRPLRVSCPFASAVFGLNHPTDLSVAIHASVRAPSVGMSGPGFGEEEVSAVHATGFYRFYREELLHDEIPMQIEHFDTLIGFDRTLETSVGRRVLGRKQTRRFVGRPRRNAEMFRFVIAALVLLLAQSDSQVGRGGGEVRGRAWQKRAVSLNAFKFG